MVRQQSRDHWSRRAIRLDHRDFCNSSTDPMTAFGKDSRGHCINTEENEASSTGQDSVPSLPFPVLRSPFEEAACQPEDSSSPSASLSFVEDSEQLGQRKHLGGLQSRTCSFEDSDSIRMDDLQSTVRLLSMSFGS